MKTDKEWLEDWVKLHQKYTVEGSDIRNNKMADYCEEKILEAKEAYYDSGETIMSDKYYDRLEDNLKILRPDSKVLEKVG